jgi:hypothetical protein
VKAILYQPWARGQGHSYYYGIFPGPLQMHLQIETSYLAAIAAIDAAFGPGSARRAAVGEALALRNFSPALYIADLSHPRPNATVLGSCAVYSAIYGARVCDLSPDFATPSNLGSRLNYFGIESVQWAALAGIADRVAAPATRRLPGSGEDFLLSTGSAGMLNSCPVKKLSVGQTITFMIHSPIGTYNGRAARILFDLLPELSTTEIGTSHTNPLTAQVAAQTPALAHGGTSYTLTIPPDFAGRTFIVEGMVLGYSAKTGLSFTMTDAHLLPISP